MKKIISILAALIAIVTLTSIGTVNVPAAESEKTYTISFIKGESGKIDVFDTYYVRICLEGEDGRKTEIYTINPGEDSNYNGAKSIYTYSFSAADVGEVKYVWFSAKPPTTRGYDYDFRVERIDVNGVGFATNGFYTKFDYVRKYCDGIDALDVTEDNYLVTRLCRGELPKTDFTCKIADTADSGSYSSTLYERVITKDGSKIDIELGDGFDAGDTISKECYGVRPEEIECIQLWTDDDDDVIIEYIKFGDIYFPTNYQYVDEDRYITIYPGTMRKYELTIHTANKWYAGTDSDVYVEIIGQYGGSGRMLLDKSHYNDFEMNDTDTYTINMRDMGEIEQLYFKLDGSDAWCLGYVEYNGNRYILNKWLDDYESTIFNLTSEKVGEIEVGSMFGTGSIIIIAVIAVLLIGGAVVTVIVVKKRKMKVSAAGRNESAE